MHGLRASNTNPSPDDQRSPRTDITLKNCKIGVNSRSLHKEQKMFPAE